MGNSEQKEKNKQNAVKKKEEEKHDEISLEEKNLIQEERIDNLQEKVKEQDKLLEEKTKENEENKKKLENMVKLLKKEHKKRKSAENELNEQKKVYNLPKENEIIYLPPEEEKQKLLVAKKDVLKTQLRQIAKRLDNIKDINEISEKFNNNRIKNLNDKFIDVNEFEIYCCCCKPITYLNFNFKFIGFFFVMFFFIGLNQLLWIINSTKEEMIFGFKSFLFRTNRTDYYPEDFNYIENYKNNIFRDLPDFNLFFFCSIFGNLILKCTGYRISLFIYMVINTVFIFLFRMFDFPENYGIYQLLLIIVFYFMFSFSIGSISFYAQQIYFDGLNKYYLLINKKNNKNNLIQNENNINDDNSTEFILQKNNSTYFFIYLWFTEIPAFIINLVINYFLRKIDYFSGYGLDFFLSSLIIFLISSIISILIYTYYSRVFNKDKDSKNDVDIRVNRICGYLIYCEENVQGKRNLDPDSIEVNAISVPVNEYYLQNQKNICCYSCKLGAKKFLNNIEKTCFDVFKCCFKIIFCCCCCYREEDGYHLSELNQGKERFCYIYKIQRELSWFCDLLFKNNILNLIIYSLINELLILGFLKQLKISLKTNEFDLNSNIYMISFFLIYFTFFACLNKLIPKKCLEKLTIFEDFQIKNDENNSSDEYKKQIWSTTFLTISNLIFTIIFSGFLIFGPDILKEITLKYLITFPIALTKFYNFILTNCLLNTMDYGNIDLLSNSLIISLFLMVYNLLSFLFTEIIIDVEPRILIILQFGVGIFFPLLFFILIIVHDCCYCRCSYSCTECCPYPCCKCCGTKCYYCCCNCCKCC